MSERAIADIFVALFYMGIFYGIFCYIKIKRHPLRSQWKSFWLVTGCVLLALTVSASIIFLVDALVDLPRNNVTTAFGVGVVTCAVIKAWRWSIARIKSAKT